MTGDPQTPGPEAERPYAVIFSRQARRNPRENLPLDVAAAAMETIDGPLATSPHRVGKPLDEPFDGYHSARRGTYRSSTVSTRINTPRKSTPSGTDGTPTGPDPEKPYGAPRRPGATFREVWQQSCGECEANA
jgi:mRNA interferase RelE/StbE